MPDHAAPKTVVIVGAGIVGVSTALWLQRRGHHVTLIDKEGPAAGASFGNGGVLAACSIVPVTGPGLLGKAPRMLLDPNQPLFFKWRYLPRALPWLLRYLRHCNAPAVRKRAAALTPVIGDTLAEHQALSMGTGAERFIVPTDYLYLYDTKAHFEADTFGWDVRRENGFTWDVLDRTALQDYDPCFSPNLACAVRMGEHGRITDPGAYVSALAQHLEQQGGRVLKSEVTGFMRNGDIVTGVRAGGDTIACDAAVLCTGAWSAPLARALGLSPPLETERGYHLELWEPNIVPRAPVMVASGKFVITPMDGRLRLAGIVEFGGLEAPPSRAPFTLLKRSVQAAIPGLTWARTEEWMGHRPSMADSTPVIGPAPGLKGAFLGFGHDHIGLTAGPKTGRILSQLVSGTPPNIDLAPFSPTRFH